MWVIFQIFCGKESVFWVLINVCLQCLCYSLHDLSVQSPLQQVSRFSTPPVTGATQACAFLHVLALEASETVGFNHKSFISCALGCVASTILPQCTFGVSHSRLVTQNPGTVIVWVFLWSKDSQSKARSVEVRIDRVRICYQICLLNLLDASLQAPQWPLSRLHSDPSPGSTVTFLENCFWG